MKSPSEITAEAVRDELYARATFVTLISRPLSEWRAAIEIDPRAQSEFMARLILDYYEENYDSTPPEHGLELVEAARAAGRDGEPHLRCRAEKMLATVLCYLGRFSRADAALLRASAIASQTTASRAHAATIALSRAVLCETTDHPDEATRYFECAICGFEEIGAYDRAYGVREYDAFRRLMRGEYVYALAVYHDVARRARDLRYSGEVARACYNIGLCYRGLSDFAAAQRYFRKTARIHRARGVVVLEAKALRCVARMAIRLHGDLGIGEMEAAKNIFLAIGAAGEVCRSTVAIIEELLLCDARTDITSYVLELEDEARVLGVLPQALDAVKSLNVALSNEEVTAQLLQKAWDAFGPTSALPAISAVAILEN